MKKFAFLLPMYWQYNILGDADHFPKKGIWQYGRALAAPYSVGILGKEIYHSLPQFPPRDDMGINAPCDGGS